MAVGVQKAWSTTAATNASADSNINFAEGQAPASLNNSARAEMAAVKSFANQITAALTSGGSANAHTLTSDAPGAISTAYAAGMGFVFRAGYTNTGATTLNVDGVGAKSIKKGGALSALVANDIVAGGIYAVYYQATGDCFVLLNPETGQTAAGNQPLDATLTALAALSWSSGNALVQFTAADTVSLTLAPSVSSVTANNAAANTTPAGTFTNSTDNASVTALRIEGDRATPANNDTVYMDVRLSSAAGVQTTIGRLNWVNFNVTAGSENTFLYFALNRNGSLTNYAILTPTDFRPNANDGIALGVSGTAFADLFLASGGVINWNAGNFTLTHSAGLLSASGAIQARVPVSTETTGTLTSASANKKVVCTGGITLPNAVFSADDFTLFDPGTSSRTFTRGASIAMYVNGTDSASATLAANQIGAVHWRSASVAVLTGAFT